MFFLDVNLPEPAITVQNRKIFGTE